ncbi:UDP-N-acetylglucosamine 1-carboxyvinyltransferase, partial [Candidatus Aerophobetes bacterium]|nr:UDP-N-acetylglucosamine 1-carboxyvinyltransferase [Candidatus Aerophobetes bacterium]
QVNDGYIEAKAPSYLVGDTIHLNFPSVGATENLLLAASLARGTTVIRNASRAPEVVDLCNFLQKAGVKITGTGTDTLTVEGVRYLSAVDYSIIPDRVEAGTFIIAAGITAGEILLEGVEAEHLKMPILKLKSMGIQIKIMGRKIHVKGPSVLQPVKVKTMPHPGFPTDLQPQITSLACLTQGKSKIVETIFESRFSHIPELRKMGANIHQRGTKIEVTGVPFLHGAQVVASDIRGGAALALAGLAAKGETEILNPHYMDRGYENLEEKLAHLGATIKREKVVT